MFLRPPDIEPKMRSAWPSELSMFTFHKRRVIWVQRNTGSCVSKCRGDAVIPGTVFTIPFLSIYFFPLHFNLTPWDEIHSIVTMDRAVKPLKTLATHQTAVVNSLFLNDEQAARVLIWLFYYPYCNCIGRKENWIMVKVAWAVIEHYAHSCIKEKTPLN